MDAVARAWTLAWAVMNDRKVQDEIPEAFFTRYKRMGIRSRKLRDEKYVLEGRRKQLMKKEVERAISYIKKKVLSKM